MNNKDFPILTSPYDLGPVHLRNRAIIPGHSMVHGDSSGLVSDKYKAYLVERAKGGVAMVGMESAPIHPHSRTWVGQIELWRDEIVDSLSQTAMGIHDEGAKLSIILWHGGHNVSYRRHINPAVAPSVVPSVQIGEIPREIRTDEIISLIRYYSEAAKRCADSGVDVIEVQTSSDYLLGSFLNPQLNRRTDKYGGSIEKRCRIIIEILEGIRKVIPSNKALGIRTSIFHAIPGEPEGYTIKESLPAVQHIASTGLIDYVSVMAGSNANFSETIPPITYPRPQIANLSQEFKKSLDIPVTVAGRIITPEDAETILSKGQADLVGIARAVIADANWMKKVTSGEPNRIRLCSGCNQVCLGFAARSLPAGCNINPEAGYELELPELKRVNQPKKIAIVGGGPAGLECARVCAERGHRVTLYESSPYLGGMLKVISDSPNREEMGQTIDWWENELRHNSVNIALNRSIEKPEELDADKIVWATGAKASSVWQMRFRPSLVNGIPGTDDFLHGRDVLQENHKLEGSIAIIDEEGSWPLLNLIEAQINSSKVKKITVISNSLLLGMPDLFMTGEFPLFSKRISDAGVVLNLGQFVKCVNKGIVETTSGNKFGPFDRIILSMGSASRNVPDGVNAIGDCVAPRDIWAAVQEGNRLGRNL